MIEPKLRFKADDGSQFPDWEEKSYLSICNVFADGDWIESKDQSDSGIRLIQTGNIGNGVFIDKDDKKKYISKETFDRLKCNEVFEGDILISRLPSPAGRACIVPKLNERMITAVDCTIVRTDKSIILHDYCVQFMQSSKHFYYVASMMAGGTRQRISRKNLEDELISVPCLEEQQKIADCLSSLDEVIENQKATLAAWEERKKGVMQKLFGQEVRFKADDGSEFPEWEEKSYLSICNVFADGDWIESKDQSDSGIRLIQTGNIGNGVFIDKDDKKKYISKETFDRLKCNEVFEGDILISRLPSPAGRACIVPKLNERMITAVDCTIVRTDKSIILHDYCVQFMQSSKHFYYVASMMAGGTRQRISRKNLEDELISVPCLEEQQKIADCLSSLDEVIENQKATLAAWEELKKGLLQQMFV